jgi:membrane AbrB-like protein
MAWLATIAVAIVCGLALHRLRVPGGALLGSLIGTAVMTGLVGNGLRLPATAAFLILASVGTLVGTELDRERVRALRGYILPAVLSGLVLVGIGLGSAVLLMRAGIAPESVFLATSPGGLSVLVAVATEQGRGEAGVTVFHTVRLLLILALMPFLLRRLMPSDG